MTSLVADVMTRNVVSVREYAEFKEILHVMRERQFSAFPVLDSDELPVVTKECRLVGIVSRVDLLGVCDRADSDIRTEILHRVIDAGFTLESRAFRVTVTSGVVTLAGPVDREPVAISLLDAVRQVDGVVAVRDRLSYPRS